jgi:hypothetical protein
MPDNIYVGIDGGKNTGFAVWNKTRQRFETIMTLTFWECIEELESLNDYCKEKKHTLTIIVEDVSANKTTFKRKSAEKWAEGKGIELNERIMNKISRNVGSVMRETDLLMEWIERHKIKLVKSRPTKKSLTKLNPEVFKDWTKWEGETNQHERDSAMLCWRR